MIALDGAVRAIGASEMAFLLRIGHAIGRCLLLLAAWHE
jgi:hypothetical protein